jgi:hypothetical protein
MSVLVDTLDELRQHLAPILTGRAGPDAGEVGPAVLMLMGAILWRKDPGPVEVRAPGMAWVSFAGERYLLRYDPHAAGRGAARLGQRRAPARGRRRDRPVRGHGVRRHVGWLGRIPSGRLGRTVRGSMSIIGGLPESTARRPAWSGTEDPFWSPLLAGPEILAV